MAPEGSESCSDAGGGQIVIRGGRTEGGMLLEGQIHDVAHGKRRRNNPVRMV
jgi:hypothetical protein